MRPFKKVAGGLAAAAALAVMASGCAGFDQETPGGSASGGEQKLTIALQFAPQANWSLDTDDAFVLSRIGCAETLVYYDAESGELKPMLATEWTQTEPTAWDFKLRDGVKFQDGTDLTAEVVVADLERLLKSDTPPRAFTPATVSGVSAPDATTVRITTPEPSALVPYRLASVNTGILSPKAFTGSGTDPKNTCTGPFTITSEVPKQSVTLQRNEGYWGEKAALASVEARFLPEGATRATQVQTGESQIALAVPAAAIPQLEGDTNLAVSHASTPRTTGLYFNSSKAPFDNADLRKAVQAALDLEAIATSVYDGGAIPAVGPFAADEPWAPQGAAAVARNLETAKSLLASSGVDPSQLKLTLLAYNERAEFADLAAVIQANLAEIGITVEIRQSDYAGIEADLLEGNYDLTLLSRNHLADIADPLGFLTADYGCDGGFNISKFCDKAIDAELAKANGIADADERYAIYASIASKLQADAVTVFIVHEETSTAQRTNVQNFVVDPLSRYAVTPTVSLG